MDAVKKVNIVELDRDTVEKDSSFPEALAFYIRLSDVPGSVWTEIFVSEYEQAWFNLEREVSVRGDRIRVVTAPGEEQAHINFIKQLVEQTNTKVEEYNKEIEREAHMARREQSAQAEMVEQAKERLRKVSL